MSMSLKKILEAKEDGRDVVTPRVFYDLGSFRYRGKDRMYVYRKILLVWWFWNNYGELDSQHGVISLSFKKGSSCRLFLESLGYDEFPENVKSVRSMIDLFTEVQRVLSIGDVYIDLRIERKNGYINILSANRVIDYKEIPVEHNMSANAQVLADLYLKRREESIKEEFGIDYKYGDNDDDDEINIRKISNT